MDVAERTSAQMADKTRGTELALASLRSSTAVRKRCRIVRDWVAAGRSQNFTLDEARLAGVAGYVAKVTRANYPDLKIPPHSRWRHFSAGGTDRWALIARRIGDARERARAAIDLATVSVLLDAGAGDQWRYQEQATGQTFARSEGLAIASLDMFTAGLFSSRAGQPLQVDATALKTLDQSTLAKSFQIGVDNPLIGLKQRLALLQRLGDVLATRPDLFGISGRPGALADHLARLGNRIAAPLVLHMLLDSLAAIWPSALVVDGTSIGDAGYHPAVRTSDATDRIVPFHKLTQWLTYSLIEPLTDFGLTVTDLDGLTALPEYRNGGLLIDLGVISPRRPIETPQATSSELIVEWRALTVSLMDDLLGLVRQQLGLDAAFTLPHLLQGGTWAAGRRIAFELRPPAGSSPVPLLADGTVF